MTATNILPADPIEKSTWFAAGKLRSAASGRYPEGEGAAILIERVSPSFRSLTGTFQVTSIHRDDELTLDVIEIGRRAQEEMDHGAAKVSIARSIRRQAQRNG